MVLVKQRSPYILTGLTTAVTGLLVGLNLYSKQPDMDYKIVPCEDGSNILAGRSYDPRTKRSVWRTIGTYGSQELQEKLFELNNPVGQISQGHI